MDRAGLRRTLLKAQAEAGDIGLVFADASEALTHPYLAHVWAKKGADLRVPAPGQCPKVAMLGMLDWAHRELIVHTSRTKRSSDFIALVWMRDVLGARDDLKGLGQNAGIERRIVVGVGASGQRAQAFVHDDLG